MNQPNALASTLVSTKPSVGAQAAWPASVQRVIDVLHTAGHSQHPVMLDGAARTAQQAADALGVELGQIAKSIVFMRQPDGVHVLVITAGDRRVDTAKVEAIIGAPGQRLAKATADDVRECTGFAIGGVPPVAHARSGVTLIDQSLQRFDVVWAAAGHPHAVFQIPVGQLEPLTGARFQDVVEESV
jgi:prolyl-tRNA editing enzyme YbaK/EbsC (Cys-tRNA(Pro) deacylase)